MVQRSRQLLLLLGVMFCSFTVASAGTIAVGLLSYDAIASSFDEFDITNLTGAAAFPPSEPITTPLTFTITSLVVDFSSGPPLTLPGSDFTVVDTSGDVDCTVLPACNLSGDSITSATLTGTLSPTTGLSGLPPGDTGILPGFTTTIVPTCGGSTLTAGCDTALIYATAVTTTVTPEPGTVALVAIGMIGLLLSGCRRLRSGAGPRSSTA